MFGRNVKGGREKRRVGRGMMECRWRVVLAFPRRLGGKASLDSEKYPTGVQEERKTPRNLRQTRGREPK